jgi:hypothetical protein
LQITGRFVGLCNVSKGYITQIGVEKL